MMVHLQMTLSLLMKNLKNYLCISEARFPLITHANGDRR